MFHREIETMPRTDLAALQLQRLQQSLQHAYANVDHFKCAFDKARVKPDRLTSLDALKDFPFTLKDDLRANYPFGMFAVPQDEIVRIHASSGTTGKPTIVGYSRHDLKIWAELMARSLVTMGVTPRDVFQNANGYGLFTGGLGFHDGAQKLGAMVVPISGGNTERQIQLMIDLGTNVLAATPSYALHIAETAKALGQDLKSSALRIGCFGAEPWSDQMRQELETQLGIRAMDMYGLSEIIGPGVACECFVAQDGLHCWEDHFYFEIIDPITQETVPVGESGEFVVTTLTKQALPMIRYRTRDITCLIDEPCKCGRTHMRLKRITGRSDDMLIIRGVNIFPSQIEALLVGFEGLAPHYVLVVEHDGSMDKLTIEVEAEKDSSQNYGELAKRLRHHIKTMAGINCQIDVKAPGEIPRSQGKAVRVRDLRK